MAESVPRKRRFKYLVDKEFQFKHLRILVLFMTFGVVIGALAVYHSLWSYMSGMGVLRHEVFAPLINSIGLTVLLEIILLVPLCIIASIFVSHRIAGPLIRIESTLKSIVDGDFGVRIKLRKHDEFDSIAESVNSLAQRLDKLKSSGQLKW